MSGIKYLKETIYIYNQMIYNLIVKHRKENTMVFIKFRYKDKYTRGDWSYQDGWFDSLKECIEFYGLNEPDCEKYEIINIKRGK